MDATTDAIRAKALELGFDSVGFARAELGDGVREGLRQYLGAGRHGDMAWLERNLDRREAPQSLWPEAATVIVLGMNYGPDHDPLADLAHAATGNISVYARGRDYHDVVKKRLKQLGRWLIDAHGGEIKVFVDTAPVMEKPLAQKAGLGTQGKHTCLIDRDTGSYFFLGELYTDLPLPLDEPAPADVCGGCRACINACPTGAITGPYELDARLCISYQTIENPGSIPESLRPLMGNRVYGCDDCQLVCPWNRYATDAEERDFRARNGLDAPDLVWLFSWSEDEFLRRFEGSPVRRLGHALWLRNVAVALGNAPTTEAIVEALRGRREHPEAIVREHVDWALARHGVA